MHVIAVMRYCPIGCVLVESRGNWRAIAGKGYNEQMRTEHSFRVRRTEDCQRNPAWEFGTGD
jgi:hypothetical protein